MKRLSKHPTPAVPATCEENAPVDETIFDAVAYVDRHWQALRYGTGNDGAWPSSYLRGLLGMMAGEPIPTNADAIAVAVAINRRNHGPVRYEDSYASITQERDAAFRPYRG